MAVSGAEHPRRRWLDALFGEAFELGRRRRNRRLLVALLVCAAAAGGGAGLHFGGGWLGPAAGTRVRISSAPLPASGNYWQIAAVGGHLVLTGGAPAIEQQRVNSIADDETPGSCTSATVDPSSLRVLSTATGSCGDPALYGRRVLPITYLASRRGFGTSTLALRVAVLAPATRSGFRLGSIVVRYPQCSDCGVEWIYGDGSLWIYAPLSTPHVNKDVGELFRVSERSGRVLQQWRMPVFTRALLAADADGIWIAQSFAGGVPEGVTRAQRIDYESIYRVAPGMRTPQRARRIGTWGANWLLASGHSVWIDVSLGRKPAQLWRLDGASASPVINARRVPSSSDCVQTGEGSGPMTGSQAAFIYCQNQQIEPGSTPPLQRFNPTTGADHSIHVPAILGSSVALGRSVYFLGTISSGSRTRIYKLTSA